jgi:23S rRNA pseudouridine2605 synthase
MTRAASHGGEGSAVSRARVPGRGVPAPEVSLARALSKLGVCSRREAERWIEAGRVTVSGRKETRADRRVDLRRDLLAVDGTAVGEDVQRIALVLHKPVGYVTTRVDPAGRPTVYDLLEGVGRWVFPVGRLDRDSSGLLLLTNDHRLGHRLTDPGHEVPKTYHARVRGIPDREALQALRDGVALPDGSTTRPARVRVLGAARAAAAGAETWLEIVLTEGRNRQVRRMCAAVGHDVTVLVRVAVGALRLGDLPAGAWRRLGPAELRLLSPATRDHGRRKQRAIVRHAGPGS